MSQTQTKFDQIPKPLVKIIQTLSQRYNQIVKQYKSLAYYGRPLFESIEEVATIVWLNERKNIGLNQLALWIGVTKETLYNLMKKLEKQNRITIYDRSSNRVLSLPMTKEKLLSIIDEKLETSSKSHITDPLQSSILQNFMKAQIKKRKTTKGHSKYLSRRHKLETINSVRKIMEYIASINPIRKKEGKPELPTNPDLWTEDMVLEIVEEMYGNGIISDSQRYRILVTLRRVPEWNHWFDNEIRAVTNVIKPKDTVLYYKDYLKIKKLYKEGKLKEQDFLLIWLHITTGAREGWNACKELEECNTSLVGLRWEKLRHGILEIHERKTGRDWECDLTWLDEEAYRIFMKYRREKGSIIRTLTGFTKVKKFEAYYKKLLRRISKELGLDFELTPHDMRRSHISILAEFGVPMEIAVSGRMDLGVGWEDLKTALIFYLRFSKHVKEQIMNKISQAKKIIEAKYGYE